MLFSCERNVETEEGDWDTDISFAQDVSLIIDGRCLKCHSGTQFPDNKVIGDYWCYAYRKYFDWRTNRID